MEGLKMATFRKGERPFTYWVHIENGAPVPRRFHKIVEHFGDEPGVEMATDRMPSTVVTYSGDGYKGQHEAHFHYSGDAPAFTPNFRPHRRPASWRRSYYAEPAWPTRRDAVHMAIGLLVIGILRFIAAASVLGGY